MKHAMAWSAVFVAGVLTGALSNGWVRAAASPYETREILQTRLDNLPGQELRVFESTWQPGFRLPLHVHPDGHEITYVIEGEQTFYIDGVGTKIVKAGEATYTPPNTPHYGSNLTDKPSKTVVIRLKAIEQPIMREVKR